MNQNSPQQQLFLAIRLSRIEQIESACNKGADINHYFEEGTTPLTAAILEGMGSPKAVKELLRLGANPDKPDLMGWTPWMACLARLSDCVVAEAQESIRSLLIQYNVSREGEDIIYLWQYALEGNVDQVKVLLEKGVNPNPQIVCPLNAAVLSDSAPTVELLLQYGAVPDGMKDNQDLTPLMYAASNGNLAIVQLLVAHGADIYHSHCEEDEEFNAIGYALEKGYVAVADWLRQYNSS